MSHQVRGMSKAEEHLLVEWAAAEGWNPGLHDADSFWNLDPEGFLGIELDGMFVGGGAVIRHNQSFGFMGLFIVDPKYRGRQLGTKLWMARRDHLLSRLGSDATIGLDGVDAMVPFYARGGFREFTRHRRFELLPADDSAEPEHGIVDLNDVEFSDVLALDRKCFPGDRQQFLSSWLNQPGGVALGTVDDRGLRGFGLMRPCRSGWKIGPLFAEDFSAADGLFQAFVRRANRQAVSLDVPDNNPDALRLCRKYPMNEVFGCTRMYLGPIPQLSHSRIYGITTLETG